MALIDHVSPHPVGKIKTPAYKDENFVVALIDDFIACLEFQDSTFTNLATTSNPNGPNGYVNTGNMSTPDMYLHWDIVATAKN